MIYVHLVELIDAMSVARKSLPAPMSIPLQSTDSVRYQITSLGVSTKELGEKLYLHYFVRHERADVGENQNKNCTFIPQSVWITKSEGMKNGMLVEHLTVPWNMYKAGSAIYIVYAIEEEGNSFGMHEDWSILGAYPSEEEANTRAMQFSKMYKEGYFHKLISVNIFCTTVRGRVDEIKTVYRRK